MRFNAYYFGIIFLRQQPSFLMGSAKVNGSFTAVAARVGYSNSLHVKLLDTRISDVTSLL